MVKGIVTSSHMTSVTLKPALASWKVSLSLLIQLFLEGWSVMTLVWPHSFHRRLPAPAKMMHLEQFTGSYSWGKVEAESRPAERPWFPIFLPFENRSNSFQTEYWWRFYYVQSKPGFIGVSYLKWIMEVMQNKFYCRLYLASAVSRFMFSGGFASMQLRMSLDTADTEQAASSPIENSAGAFGFPW